MNGNPLQMELSVIRGDMGKPERVVVTDLPELITRETYSASVFKPGGRRTIADFESASLLILDFDNKPRMLASDPKTQDPAWAQVTLEQAKEQFAGYRHIIAPTRSHLKDGVTHRFRVVLFLSSPITDSPTYYATWFAMAAKFPDVDRSTKDPARMWYPSSSIYSLNDTGALVEPVAPPPKHTPAAVAEPRDPAAKGKLARRTLEILAGQIGAAPKEGGRKVAVYKAARDLHQNNYALDEAYEMLEGKAGGLEDDDFRDAIECAYKTAPKHEPRDNPGSAGLVDFLSRAKLIINIADPAVTTVVDLERGIIRDVHQDTIRKVLPKDTLQMFFANSVVHAEYAYNPRQTGPLRKDSLGIDVYNTYAPPEWKREHFFFGTPLPAVPALPALYEEYFTHLTGGDADSKEYLLDWLATSLTSRNFTMLTAIGAQGIGKGLLGSILEQLHGSRNFHEGRDQVFKSHFNAQIMNKTLVYVDEVDLRTKDAQDRMKAMVNEHIEIERKGHDAVYAKNYASFYLSSNTYDAIRMDHDDRRFSIIQLTEKSILDTPLGARLADLTGAANIRALAHYLVGRPVNRAMNRPFKSARTEEVKEASLADWESWLVHEWAEENAGGKALIRDLQDRMVADLRLRGTPGRRKFAELALKYPKILEVRKSGKQGSWVLVSRLAPELRPGPGVGLSSKVLKET